MRKTRTTQIEHPLPASIDVEEMTLGAVMLNNSLLSIVSGVLVPNDFFRDAHRRIYEAMLRLSARGSAIDLATLQEELSKKGDLDEVGSVTLLGLIDGVPLSNNVEHYARIVLEKSHLRDLIYAANKMRAEAYAAQEDAAQVLADAEAAIYAIGQRSSGGDLVDGARMAQEGFQALERLQASGRTVGLSTGLREFDEHTLGLHRKHLSVLAARPGNGKSALMLHLARYASMRQQVVTAVFSLEMSREELILRMLSSEGGIDGHDINRGHATSAAHHTRLSTALTRVDNSKLFVDDSPNRSMMQIRSQCQRLKSQQGSLGLVLIDYLQLITAHQQQGRQTNREQEVGAMAWACKQLSKELDVPVVLLSQLSRQTEGRAGQRPVLSDLRESGAIEQHADDVFFLWPPDDPNGTMRLSIAKQRNGPKSTVTIGYDPAQYRFWDLAPEGVAP